MNKKKKKTKHKNYKFYIYYYYYNITRSLEQKYVYIIITVLHIYFHKIYLKKNLLFVVCLSFVVGLYNNVIRRNALVRRRSGRCRALLRIDWHVINHWLDVIGIGASFHLKKFFSFIINSYSHYDFNLDNNNNNFSM